MHTQKRVDSFYLPESMNVSLFRQTACRPAAVSLSAAPPHKTAAGPPAGRPQVCPQVCTQVCPQVCPPGVSEPP